MALLSKKYEIKEIKEIIQARQSYIDFSDDKFREDDVRFCPHCLEYNSKIPLTSRIYPVGEPVPVDKDNWKQCIDCRTIYPVYEI